MADNIPFKYRKSDSELTEKEVLNAVKYQTTKNNLKEPKSQPKDSVFNPLSLLLLDPTFTGQKTMVEKFIYNKKIADGKLDKITDKEKLLFESKVDPKQPFLKRIFDTTTYLQRDTEKELDAVGEVVEGAITGLPLAGKAALELLTTGVDYKFDTNFTKKLDDATDEFLKYTGEPETFAGQISQLGAQFTVPFGIINKLVGNIGKLKPLINKIPGMNVIGSAGSKIVNKNRFIKTGANIAQRMGTSGLALGATDFIFSGRERMDPIFFERTNEEGKTGKELAAARFANKIKFGKEGALIGAGFPLIGTTFGLGVRGIGYGVGVTYDTLGRVINPLVTGVTKAAALDTIVLPSLIKGVRLNVGMYGEVATKTLLTLGGKPQAWTKQLPDYNQWRKFTVDDVDPIKRGLKRIDNALSAIRSAGKNTASALFIKGSASRDIRASAKKIQDLLKSIENKSYSLAKGFETTYNTNKTSPSLMNQYLDEVLEVLENKRKLSNLPQVMQNTVKMLKDEITKIGKTYKKFVPDDDSFAHALTGGTKSYIKKSFAFLNNPGYAMPITNPIFTNAAKFVEKVIKNDRNLIDEAIGAAGKGVSKTKAIKDYSNVMIKQILQLGKVDNRNPMEVLRKVGERLNLENFLKQGEELPNVINKLLGQEKNLRNNVLFTTANMMSSVSNKQMYDSLARVMLKEGQVFTSAAAARAAKGTSEVVQIGRINGMSGLKTKLSDLYTDAETARILTTNRGPLDILAEIPGYATMLQFKAGVQWGKTVGSPATGSRNFVTAADFALMRGLIGGRASVTNSVKMQLDDIYNSGKLSGSAEQKLLENIEEGIKYGALDENIVVTELRELLKATQKGKKIGSFDSMIKIAGDARIVELMGKLYAGGDHVWKWYGYNWYKSFLSDYARKDMGRMKEWFRKVAGRELDMLNNDGSKKTLDQAIKEASAYYVRNTMPTYSKVPPLIKGVRNLPLGNFVAFPAETLRGTFNVMNISTKEILSGDPILREMGYRGLIGMFTTQGAKGLAIMKTYGALTGLTQDIMKDYQANLAPGYQRNSQLLAITKAVKGKFKMVDLSTILPYDYVQRPWRALNNAIKNKEIKSENSMNFMLGLMFDEEGPMRELLDPFISTPIGLEAMIDIKRGYTKNGKRIWGELDDDETKMNKSFDYITKALEPGAITTLRQLYSSITGVPYKGRVYDQQDVLTGLFTGVKPYDVDVNRNIDFLINDYSRIRTKAFQASDLYDLDAYGDVVTEDFINIQRNIFREQQRIYRAFKTAQKFGVSKYAIKKEMRERNISRGDIRRILGGRMDPLPFSADRFENKIKDLKKIEKDRGSNRMINKRSFYPKMELKSILRKLKRQKLDEEFMFDKIITTDPPRFSERPALSDGFQSSTQAEIQTPPLPKQPEPVAAAAALPKIDPVTQLTSTETALLSPDEQAIRLKQRGIA